MRKDSMKMISRLLVVIMVMTIALPQGVAEKKGKPGTVKVVAEELSGTDVYEEKPDESTDTDNKADGNETGNDSAGNPESDEEVNDNVGDESSSEENSSDEPATDESSSEESSEEESTSEEETTIHPDFVVDNGVLVKYLHDINDEENKEIIIPASITKIDNNVFYGYKFVEKITFEEGSLLTEIAEQVFEECRALKTIAIPEGVTVIGEEAFRNCIALEYITLPQTITKIGTKVFYGCATLSEIILPERLKTIGYRAFYGATGIKNLTIPSTVTAADEILGTQTNVTTVTFAKGTTKIPAKVLYNAATVKTVVMYKGVTEIGKGAFRNCTKLTGNDLPNTIKKIGKNAFRKCTSLKKLTLHKSITSIGTSAFAGDTKLTVKVYANSYGKAYARKNNIKWKYKASETKRMAEDKRVYEQLMSKNVAKYKGKYQLINLENYIPQGTCVIGKYIVVSMHHKKKTQNSILVLYNKTGDYVKTLKLTVRDHVGSVTNVKKNLLVGLNNVSGSNDQVGVIKYSALKKAKNGSTIKFKYRLKLNGAADFAAYDGTYYWAGKSANNNNCLMYGYKVKINKKGKITLTNTYNLYVPANTQGLSVQKISKNRRKFILSQSYGRIADSYLYEYSSVNIKTAARLENPTTTVVLPSMIEGICMYKKRMYMVFESGASKYCSDPDNTSEIQMENLSVVKYTTLLKLK